MTNEWEKGRSARDATATNMSTINEKKITRENKKEGRHKFMLDAQK